MEERGKMATKDWKRKKTRTKNVQYWENPSTGAFVEVVESFIENEGNNFHVTSNMFKEHTKHFKFKSQALTFAHKYMRTH